MKTTNNIVCQPYRPELCAHSTVCHKKEFKAADGANSTIVEVQNSLIKGPFKALKDLLKFLTLMLLDQSIFEE